MANQQQTNANNNAPSLPQLPKKPSRFKNIVWTGGGFILVALAILYVASSVVSSTHPKAAKNQTDASPTSPEAIPGFSSQANTAANTLKVAEEKTKEIQEMWANARGPLPMVCNAEVRERLNGRHWFVPATVSGVADEEYVCTDKDKWDPVQLNLTDAQKAAENKAQGINPRGPTDRMPTAAEIYAYKAQLAFKSDSVQVHYSDAETASSSGGSEGPEDPVAAAKREGDALIRAANGGHAGAQSQAGGGNGGQTAVPPQQHEVTDEEIYPWDIFLGQKYRVFEDTIIEGVLINRIEGEFGGPLKIQVSNDVYALDKTTLLIPQGSVIIGLAGASHSSSQRRLMIDPSRMIMPDGYCVRLEKVVGADQQGATGLTGRVDTHWKSLIATAAILGAVEGLGTGTSIAGSGGLSVVQISAGMNRQSAEEGAQILNEQMHRNSSIRVYEGTRVRLWVGSDLTLPAWENHRVPKHL